VCGFAFEDAWPRVLRVARALVMVRERKARSRGALAFLHERGFDAQVVQEALASARARL